MSWNRDPQDFTFTPVGPASRGPSPHEQDQARSGPEPDRETAVFQSRLPWKPDDPRALVIACSDGRHDEQLDEFLKQRLRLTDYDRVYLPGGPGGLAGGSSEYLRADQIQRECAFLVKAHRIEEVIFVFHGPAAGGPDEAVCGDYRRKYPDLSCEDINRLQESDLAETLRAAHPWLAGIQVRAFRSEVTADRQVRFVPIAVPAR